MKSAPIIIWTAQALPDSGFVYNPQPIPLAQAFGYAVQIVWTGSPDGNFFLQGSCDGGYMQPSGIVTGVNNWSMIAGTTTSAGAAAGSVLYNISEPNYFWFRIAYEGVSTPGTASATCTVKGI